MSKEKLTIEQKRLDIDIWIIVLVTLGVFLLYLVMGNQIMSFIKDRKISIIPRLLLNAFVQFGIAGLGITIVAILRKEKFIEYGLRKKNLLKTIAGTILSFTPSILYTFLSGNFRGYQPFNILITREVMASGTLFSILGLIVIVIVWGFFEGFNYVVIHNKINKRYNSTDMLIDYGAITCGIISILFHPMSFSLVGIINMLTTFIAIYGMLIVKKITGNAWGSVFAFCFLWNAL